MIVQIKLFLKNSFLYLFTLLLWIILPKKEKIDRNLFFINTGRIGDLIISSVLLENPEVFAGFDKIIFLIKEEFKELFADYKGKFCFMSYNYQKYKYSLVYRFKLLKSLRRMGFKYSFNLTAARGMLNDEISFLSGAAKTFCLNKNHKYLGTFFGKVMDKKYDAIIAEDILNEYEKNFEVMRFLNGNGKEYFQFSNLYTFRNYYNAKFELVFYNNSIAIAPFSSERNRDWPIDSLNKLISILEKKYHLIILGSKIQEKDLKKLRNGKKNIDVITDGLKLNEIPTFLVKCRLFIGIDSGLTHIALKMKVPALLLVGGGQFGRFYPYLMSSTNKFLYNKMDCFGCGWECIYPEKYCLTEVSFDNIATSLKEMNIEVD